MAICDGPCGSETEMVFAHVVREDRGILELIDSDYTFVNARLAKLYGITGVTGDEMRKVRCPRTALAAACWLTRAF